MGKAFQRHKSLTRPSTRPFAGAQLSHGLQRAEKGSCTGASVHGVAMRDQTLTDSVLTKAVGLLLDGDGDICTKYGAPMGPQLPVQPASHPGTSPAFRQGWPWSDDGSAVLCCRWTCSCNAGPHTYFPVVRESMSWQVDLQVWRAASSTSQACNARPPRPLRKAWQSCDKERSVIKPSRWHDCARSRPFLESGTVSASELTLSANQDIGTQGPQCCNMEAVADGEPRRPPGAYCCTPSDWRRGRRLGRIREQWRLQVSCVGGWEMVGGRMGGAQRPNSTPHGRSERAKARPCAHAERSSSLRAGHTQGQCRVHANLMHFMVEGACKFLLFGRRQDGPLGILRYHWPPRVCQSARPECLSWIATMS